MGKIDQLINIHRYTRNLQKADWDNNGERTVHNERSYHLSRDMLIRDIAINLFIFGHLHEPMDKIVSLKCRMIILGDWLHNFSYVLFDGQGISLQYFKREKHADAQEY